MTKVWRCLTMFSACDSTEEKEKTYNLKYKNYKRKRSERKSNQIHDDKYKYKLKTYITVMKSVRTSLDFERSN